MNWHFQLFFIIRIDISGNKHALRWNCTCSFVLCVTFSLKLIEMIFHTNLALFFEANSKKLFCINYHYKCKNRMKGKGSCYANVSTRKIVELMTSFLIMSGINSQDLASMVREFFERKWCLSFYTFSPL